MLTTAIGLTAALLTTIAFVPQAIKALKTKQTKDISLIMYILFTAGVLCWLVYGIMLGELPIILANSVTLIFAAMVLILKIRYK